jgi:hypothetical protein
MTGSGVRRTRHRGLHADASPVDDGEKDGFRFRCISPLSKGPVSLDEGYGPRRQEETGGQMGVGIGGVSPCAFRQSRRYGVREFVTDRPGAGLEGFAGLDGLDEALALGGKTEVGAAFRDQPMREQTVGLDRGDAGIAMAQSFAQYPAAFFVAIEEHVLLAGEVIEHRHPSDVGGGRDFVHRHMIEAPLDEEARCGIGNGLPRGETLTRSAVGRHRHDPLEALESGSRWTDNTRLVDTYRRGRVLLAGDAAHVHTPFGGQGLGLGLADAANLGWKLAAVIRGDMPEGLLDTYTAERRPVAQAVLANTLAQMAIMRPDPQSGAMRNIVANLMRFDDVNRFIGEIMSGLSIRYDLGAELDDVGRLIGDRPIATGMAAPPSTTSWGMAWAFFSTSDPGSRLPGSLQPPRGGYGASPSIQGPRC